MNKLNQLEKRIILILFSIFLLGCSKYETHTNLQIGDCFLSKQTNHIYNTTKIEVIEEITRIYFIDLLNNEKGIIGAPEVYVYKRNCSDYLLFQNITEKDEDNNSISIIFE